MLVTIYDLQEADHGLPNEIMADEVGWPCKVKGQVHEYLSANNSKTVRDTMLFKIDDI